MQNTTLRTTPAAPTADGVRSETVVEMKDLVATMQMTSGPAQLRAENGTYNYHDEQVAVKGLEEAAQRIVGKAKLTLLRTVPDQS